MEQNPYGAPSAVSPSTQASSTSRPIGVSILAVLHLIGGLLLFVMQFALIAQQQEMGEALRAIGIPLWLLVVGVVFLSVLTIASGVGMWLGTKWGWWLGTFYYTYGVFRNASGLVTVLLLSDSILAEGESPEYYVFRQAIRTVIQLLLLAYFLKGNVTEFFNVEAVNKVKALAIMIGICIAMLIANSTVSWLYTQAG